MRRIFSWILTLALVLGLAGCGQDAAAAWQEQYDLGVRYLSEGNYEEAIIAFTAAIEIDAKRPEGLIGRGDAYALSGDTEDNLSAALSDYEAAIALDETLPGGWLGLADVYIRQGDYDKAMEILREALEKTGNDQSIADKLSAMESGSFTDSAGNTRRESHYDESGSLMSYFTYTYDGQGYIASVTGFDAAGNQAGHVDYVYDEAGNRLVDAGNYHIDDGRLGAREYEYDAAGNAVRQTIHVSGALDSEVDYYKVNTYDGDGNVTRQENYHGNGEPSLVYEYEYADGVQTKETVYSGDGALQGYELYQYDSEGRLVRADYYDETGTFEAYDVYTYNEAGITTSVETYEADGTLIRSRVYN